MAHYKAKRLHKKKKAAAEEDEGDDDKNIEGLLMKEMMADTTRKSCLRKRPAAPQAEEDADEDEEEEEGEARGRGHVRGGR